MHLALLLGVRELTDLLQARGTDVSYAIHPVAGRMPGHLNMLPSTGRLPHMGAGD